MICIFASVRLTGPVLCAVDEESLVQEAYAMLAGHPIPQQRGDLLGALIPALFAARAIPTLLRLPLSGTAVVNREHG